uniref:PAR14-like first RRM domain-containing protein n=1 Tax=Seriola lalandi dorsalis TaxID=1841481 RepID=A0A3B4XFE1_SERLL
MDGSDSPGPVTVEGDWSPVQPKTLKNKLQLYFQSKKKSSGGDCRVEVEDGAARAAVFFRSEEVRQRVLARENHEINVENQTIRLRLLSATVSRRSNMELELLHNNNNNNNKKLILYSTFHT